jgi:carbon monoxide dehydrogenase subunit G
MGSGYVVMDVLADSKTVWETLLNFERYAEMIPTIRKVRITSRPWKHLTKGLFTLSKFRFRLSVVHKHRPDEVRAAGSGSGSGSGTGSASFAL